MMCQWRWMVWWLGLELFSTIFAILSSFSRRAWILIRYGGVHSSQLSSPCNRHRLISKDEAPIQASFSMECMWSVCLESLAVPWQVMMLVYALSNGYIQSLHNNGSVAAHDWSPFTWRKCLSARTKGIPVPGAHFAPSNSFEQIVAALIDLETWFVSVGILFSTHGI